MKDIVRKSLSHISFQICLFAEQAIENLYFSFYFNWGYYFSAGYLFYKKINKKLSNEGIKNFNFIVQI